MSKCTVDVNVSQCKDLRTGVMCSDVLFLVRMSVLDELQRSNALLCKEIITIIHPAGDKAMNTFLQILTGNKAYNSCDVFEMIVC